MVINQHCYIVDGEFKGERGVYKGIMYRSNRNNLFRFLVNNRIMVSVPHGYFKAV